MGTATATATATDTAPTATAVSPRARPALNRVAGVPDVGVAASSFRAGACVIGSLGGCFAFGRE
jgi:hypothetical protein